MNALEVIEDLSRLGVVLKAHGKCLRYRAPIGVLTPQLREAMHQNKAEILSLLNAGYEVTPQHGDIDPEQVRIPFGKHRGTPVLELEPSYISWLWRKCDRLGQFPEAEIAVAALVYEPKDKKPRDGEMAPATGYESDTRHSRESL